MARARNQGTDGGRLRIEAEALDLREEDADPQLTAYAFGQGGKLLARTDLKAGAGDLPVPETKEPEAVRVVVGPPVEGSDQEILAALTRLEGAERVVRLTDVTDAIRFPIDRITWWCWFRFCTVRGTLLKRTSPGGVTVDLPVCGAEIEIYEVDPVTVILPKIPDYVLERIREVVRRPLPTPPEERFPGGLPFPPKGPGPGPGPDPGPLSPARMQQLAAAPVRDELLAVIHDLRGEGEAAGLSVGGFAKSAGGGKDVEPQEQLFRFASGEETEASPEEATASVRALSLDPAVVTAAASGTGAFRSALLARPELLRPLLCWIWPQAVTMSLVATTTTDDCGKFRARIHVGCSSDIPDLYFRAYRRFGFFRFPIYGPTPIACNTWWDYACGSEVTLITTSPFAHTCPPCQPVIGPPHWVLAMAVGNTSLAAVHGTGPNIPVAPLGLTGPNSGWGDGAPFGGDIRLRFEFDNTVRPDLNVRFYRIRWRKVGSGNPWLDLTEAVLRHYAHMVGSTLMIEPYKLGPQPVGATANLYEIPPALPPVGQWIVADAVVDTMSSLFPSAGLAPAGGGEGLYEFELTLFDAAGAAVNATALGVNYVIPKTVDLTATIETQNASTLGLVTPAGRLIYRLYVDNNRCTALIDPPTLGGSAASDVCGVLRYAAGGDAMTLPYTASHPNGFASYTFDVHRGTTFLPAVSTPNPPGSLPVGPPPGTHVTSTTAGDLLDTCTIAGFAETLYVAASATDGWGRQSQYDDSKVRAFALAPEGA